MSREQDAMQFILDMLTDGILTSTVRQIGFTPHEKVVGDQLPFVQVFASIGDNGLEIPQPAGFIELQLEIIDEEGRQNELRDVLEQLDSTLRRDVTWQGTVLSGVISARAVAEVSNLHRTIAGATIRVELLDAFPFSEDTLVIDFSRPASQFAVTNGDIEESVFIKGMLGVRKTNPGGDQLLVDASIASGYQGLPIDLSGVKQLTLMTYRRDEAKQVADGVRIKLGSNSNTKTSLWLANHGFVVPSSWDRTSFDLANPSSEVGGGVDFSVVDFLQVDQDTRFTSFSSTSFGLIYASLAYNARDKGLNNGRGYNPET